MPTVLYIEDNRDNRMLVRRILMASDYDFQVVEADNARTGIEMASQSPPDIILMDMSMPEMDGLTATRMLRGIDLLRKVPIVALTANAFAEDREACMAAGMDDVLVKPASKAQIMEVLQRYWTSRAA